MHFKRHFISGLVTLIPLAVTWWLLELILVQLSRLGQPLVRWLLENLAPGRALDQMLRAHPWLGDVFAVLLVICIVYLLGLAAGQFLGQQLMSLFESLVDRIPLIKNIYGSAKKLIAVMGEKPDGVQRVVLLEFPNPGMKTVGLVTRTIKDTATGEELAAVYVPTTPNPTSGYLEIVPLKDLTPTDWSIDDAMHFIISGGAVAPGSMPFYAPGNAPTASE